MFGHFVPNFNFASVCFQPDILLSEANAVDYAKEISNNIDSQSSNDENQTIEDEQQENSIDHIEIEDERECETEDDTNLEDSVVENSKPKLKRVRLAFLSFKNRIFICKTISDILQRNIDVTLALTRAQRKKHF